MSKEEKENAIFGKPQSMDVSAKHFSFMAGLALLNRFDFERVPSTSPPPAPDTLELKGGSAAPAFVIEGRYRRRWAWEDRVSAKPTDPTVTLAAERAVKLAEAELASADAARLGAYDGAPTCDTNACAVADRRLAIANADLMIARNALEGARAAAATIDAYRLERSRLESNLATARAITTGEAVAPADARTASDALSSFDAASRKDPAIMRYLAFQRAQEAWRATGEGKGVEYQGFWQWTDWVHSPYSFIIPSDWDLAMGYAFVQKPDGNLTSAVGGSNLYVGAAAGINVIRFALPVSVSSGDVTRVSINIEGSTLWVADGDNQDVHDRYLLGVGLGFGVPVRYGQADGSPMYVIEVALRAGRLWVESPVWTDPSSPDNSQVETSHGFVKFDTQKGAGLDAEINFPVAKTLGYVMLRGGMGTSIDPNTWFMTIGYTVPLGAIAGGIGL